jgi:outer membrane protein
MNRTRSVFAITAILWLAIGTAEAEFIGLDIGASRWAPGLNNSYKNPESGSIDLIDDLELENPSQSSMVLILEHPIKMLPNVKYRGYELDSSNRLTLDSNINFNGQTFTSGNEVTSSYDLSHDDVVLYYQLLNNRLNLDLGVDLKSFDGEVSLNGTTSTSVEVDETIPLLYLSARYDLPNSGFYVGAHINANIIDLGLSKSSAQDSTIMLGYDSGSGLGVEGGYKSFSLDLDDVDNLDDDLQYDGVFLNGYFNF